MTAELFKTVIKLYRSEILENVSLADNIVQQNTYTERQKKLLLKVAIEVSIKVSMRSTVLTDLILSDYIGY